MTEKEIPNDILMMFETGIDLVLDPPPRPFHFDDLMEAEAIQDDDRVLKILHHSKVTGRLFSKIYCQLVKFEINPRKIRNQRARKFTRSLISK